MIRPTERLDVGRVERNLKDTRKLQVFIKNSEN
ncbi:hypothetical protein ACIQD3_13305 [Peribacillus loiseleuriae]